MTICCPRTVTTTSYSDEFEYLRTVTSSWLAINTTALQPAQLRFSIVVSGRVWLVPAERTFQKRATCFRTPFGDCGLQLTRHIHSIHRPPFLALRRMPRGQMQNISLFGLSRP